MSPRQTADFPRQHHGNVSCRNSRPILRGVDTAKRNFVYVTARRFVYISLVIEAGAAACGILAGIKIFLLLAYIAVYNVKRGTSSTMLN